MAGARAQAVGRSGGREVGTGCQSTETVSRLPREDRPAMTAHPGRRRRAEWRLGLPRAEPCGEVPGLEGGAGCRGAGSLATGRTVLLVAQVARAEEERCGCIPVQARPRAGRVRTPPCARARALLLPVCERVTHCVGSPLRSPLP